MPKVICECVKCHDDVVLGVNAIETARGVVCDDCANVVRDVSGYAWTSNPQICLCIDEDGDVPDCPMHGE